MDPLVFLLKPINKSECRNDAGASTGQIVIIEFAGRKMSEFKENNEVLLLSQKCGFVRRRNKFNFLQMFRLKAITLRSAMKCFRCCGVESPGRCWLTPPCENQSVTDQAGTVGVLHVLGQVRAWAANLVVQDEDDYLAIRYGAHFRCFAAGFLTQDHER